MAGNRKPWKNPAAIFPVRESGKAWNPKGLPGGSPAGTGDPWESKILGYFGGVQLPSGVLPAEYKKLCKRRARQRRNPAS